ncbi:MAG: hypothetical protein IPH59_13030 [bacterium]|nr:hypothetical protein [bacterium]
MMRNCFITILLLLLQTAHITAGTIVGEVALTPARPANTAINRYTGRDAVANKNIDTDDAVATAVVYLTGGPISSAVPPNEHPQMVQKDQSFVPEILPILVGTTVDFPNLDPVFHNVFSYSKAKKFDLGRYPKGHSKSVTFDTPGLVKVFCEIHSSMRAHILVLEQPFFALASEDGSFRIPNVPAGNYTLNVWQENVPEKQVNITVPASDSVSVRVD